jgi:hypothetical protein
MFPLVRLLGAPADDKAFPWGVQAKPATKCLANRVRLILSQQKGAHLLQRRLEMFRVSFEETHVKPAEASELLRFFVDTFEDAFIRLPTPSVSAESSDEELAAEASNPDPFWAQIAQASGGSAGLKAEGKFWSQKAQLQAMRRNVAALTEQSSQLMRVASELTLLQVGCISCACAPASYTTVRL